MKSNAFVNREIIKDACRGAVFGIGIGLLFQIIQIGRSTGPWDWLESVGFGAGVGFILTFSIEYLTLLTLSFRPALAFCLWFHMALDFAMGFGVFYGIASLLQPFDLNPEGIFRYSLAVGIFTILVGLFFVYSWQVKDKIRLEEENRKLAIWEERNRIAKKLHDSIVQNLFAVSLHLDTLGYLAKHRPGSLSEVFDLLQKMMVKIQSEMKLMIRELKPTVFIGESVEEKDEI